MLLKKSCFTSIFLFSYICCVAQTQADSLPAFKPASLAAPALLTAYGSSSFFIGSVRNIDVDWQRSLSGKNSMNTATLEKYMIFTPALAVYALDVAGIKGKNNWKAQTIQLGISAIMMNSFVVSSKELTHRMRPDSSSFNSFPSRHTATAFMNAEFLWQEYKHHNKWLAASGYVVAAATGYMRMHQNRHWFSDVIAGAGIGILSTKLTYWAYPRVVNMIKKKRSSK